MLVDCNSFYASCERVFQPALRDRPLVVLSNNDGCLIALTPEARQLGLELGDPYFKKQDVIEANNVAVRSSNYTLYGDMSRRVRNTLKQFSPDLEAYSIDEMFLRLSDSRHRDLTNYGRTIARTVRKWTGIPVSVAVAPTKTLCKVAMEQAKGEEREDVQNTADWKDLEAVLADLPVEDVWGIGSAYARTCRQAGINTALDLRNCSSRWARKNLTVTGLRRKRELQGISCIPLEPGGDPKKRITCSRMFGEKITEFQDLREAVVTYTRRACERLRDEGQCTGAVQVFIRTSRFEEGKNYGNLTLRGLSQPTDSTHVIARKASRCLEEIYQPGYRYHKAGVVLSDLLPRDKVQRSLTEAEASLADEKLMATFDEINSQFGKNSLQLLGEGLEKEWSMERNHLSPAFTTRWQQLPTAYAG